MTTFHSTVGETTVVRLTTRTYRRLHAIAKSEAGAALNISSFKRMGRAWGAYSSWALPALKNATAPVDATAFEEVSMVTLAERINVAAFRSCIRPELDWADIPANLIYDFILWHEIGHKADNYDQIDFFTGKCRQQEDFARLNRALLRANEVLADRYAWAKIFPSRPLPISQARSAEYLAGINADIAELDARVGRRTPRRTMLPLGFAEYIPLDVVQSKGYAAIAGVPYREKRPSYTQEAYKLSRTGPHRPVLELVEGSDSGLFCSVANSTEPKLLVGRSCRKTDLVVAATLGGYSVQELVDFVKGGGVSPRPPRNPWFAKMRRSRANSSIKQTQEA